MSRPLPPPLDQAEWDKAAMDHAANSLVRIRTSAGTWVGTLTAVLGLFGGVTLVTGPRALADLGEGERIAVLIVVGLAGLVGATGIVIGSLAAQGTAKLWEDWSGDTFAAYLIQNGKSAATRLTVSRWLGVVAAALVFSAGMYVAFGQVLTAGQGQTIVIAVSEDGIARCGPVEVADGELRVGGEAVGAVRSVHVVPRCPGRGG
ncbi:hypothetical protein ACI8AV_21390 [Geodermatophilus sp. SYSU D00804]